MTTVAINKCLVNRITIWPSDLLPYPTTCPCFVGEGARCGRPVFDTGVRFAEVERSESSDVGGASSGSGVHQ